MSSDPENLSTPKSGEAFAWYKVWYKVLTKPMASNLEQFLEAPSTTAIQALFLIYIPSLIFFELLFLGGDTQNEFGALAVAVIFVPILALFQLLTITVFISGIRLITKWFGGNSSFSNLFMPMRRTTS
jgi:hypothetical protein